MSAAFDQIRRENANTINLAYRTAKYSDPCYTDTASIAAMRDALEVTLERERVSREAGVTWPQIWSDTETAVSLGRLDGYNSYLDTLNTPEVRAALYRQHKVLAHLLRTTFARRDAENGPVSVWIAALKAEDKLYAALRQADLAVGSYGPSLELAYKEIIGLPDAKVRLSLWHTTKDRLPYRMVDRRLAQLRRDISRRMRKEVNTQS